MPQFLKTVTSAGTPVQATPNCTNAQYLLLIACKGLGGPTTNANTGKVKIGFGTSVNQQPLELSPGAVQQFFVSAGMMDLSQFWIDAATSGDGVVFQYV
jgi:hypothetical protein